MGKFFGRNVTSRISINSLACGEGKFGVREKFDRFAFGIKFGSGSQDVCYDGIIAPPSDNGNSLLNLNSNTDKFEFIEKRKYRIEKDSNTGWYRWTCRGDATVNGIESTRSGANTAGKEACGIANFGISEVLVTKLVVEYHDKDLKI
ncbi:hypothetical protein ACU8V7_23230 [Zobellia nedashkovskayae]